MVRRGSALAAGTTNVSRTNKPTHNSPAAVAMPVDLGVSAYERVASLLVALLLIVGFIVFALFLMWWAKRAIAANRPVPIAAMEELSGRGEHAQGVGREMEEPGVEELAELEQPQLADTLAAVTTAITLQPATLDELLGEADAMGHGRGQGDSRGTGPGGEGTAKIIPRWDRWEISFSASQIETYARQLDFFGIELAAMSGGSANVDYASKLSLDSPTKRSGSGAAEKRLRFGWKAGRLQEFDRQLLGKAGVDAHGRVVVQFASPALENELARLENEQLAGRDLSEVRKTVFGVESADGGYKLSVTRQDLRPRP